MIGNKYKILETFIENNFPFSITNNNLVESNCSIAILYLTKYQCFYIDLMGHCWSKPTGYSFSCTTELLDDNFNLNTNLTFTDFLKLIKKKLKLKVQVELKKKVMLRMMCSIKFQVMPSLV